MRTVLATILVLAVTPLAFSAATQPFLQAHYSKTTVLVFCLALMLLIINLRRRT